MKRINWFVGITLVLTLAAAIAWPQAAAADGGPVRTTFPSEDNPGPPFYARFQDSPPYIFSDGEWAVIYFYRDPNCVPANFNLLLFFDFADSFGGPLEVHGFDLWERVRLVSSPSIHFSLQSS
ncbi:MAG TPA: hypothetical protein VFO91_03770 [Anaerolineales bacterium]|nr:hypothetical protein [Anaerolineales bacterium]